MDINNEFYLEVLQALSENQVDFILVGGMAVGIHGYPRYTGDMDLWLAPNSSNMNRLSGALKYLQYDDDTVSQILSERPFDHPTPIRLYDDHGEFLVDLMTEIYHDEITWTYAREKALEYDYKGITIPVINIHHLISIKENTRRYDHNMKDLVDAQELKKIRDNLNE